MRRRAVLSAGVAVALAGCSGDDDGSGGNETPEEPTAEEDGKAGTDGFREGIDDEGNATTNATANDTTVDDEPEEYPLVVFVIDEEGEAVENATVAVADDRGELIEAFDGADRATTDDNGAVEATLPEGEYQAGAIADGRQAVEDVAVTGDGRVVLRIEPTDEERAADAIARAQSELSEAVAGIDEQSGDTLDAADEISRAPIADRLASARLAVADAREFETTDEQATTLDALDGVESFLGTLLEGQSWLYGIFRSVGRLREDLREGEDDRARYGATDVSRELEAGGGRIDAIDEEADSVEGTLEEVEAADWLWVDDRRTALRADYGAAEAIAETVPDLLAAEAEFWAGREEFEEGAYVSARASFGEARRAFEDVRTAFDSPESPAFEDAVEAIDCTTSALATAADANYWAADAARSGDDDREAGYVDRVEEALGEAEGCGLRPIEP